MFPRWLSVGIVILVALAWAGNLLAGFFFPGRGDPLVSWLFGLVLGTVLGLTPAQVLRHVAGRMLGRAPAEPAPPPDEPAPPDEPGRPAAEPDTPTR